MEEGGEDAVPVEDQVLIGETVLHPDEEFVTPIELDGRPRVESVEGIEIGRYSLEDLRRAGGCRQRRAAQH